MGRKRGINQREKWVKNHDRKSRLKKQTRDIKKSGSREKNT